MRGCIIAHWKTAVIRETLRVGNQSDVRLAHRRIRFVPLVPRSGILATRDENPDRLGQAERRGILTDKQYECLYHFVQCLMGAVVNRVVSTSLGDALAIAIAF